MTDGNLHGCLDEFITDALDEERIEPLDEEEKAIAILKQCGALYKSKLHSAYNSACIETLKEVSELYRVPPPLVYHAVHHGARNAHTAYRAKPPQPLKKSPCSEPESTEVNVKED